jgi:hypothetical protein
MAEPVALLAAKSLSTEELFSFARTINIPNVEVLIRPRAFCDVQLVRGDENIWISFENEKVIDGVVYKNIQYEDEDEETKDIVQKLGAIPQTFITIDISNNPRSQLLAVAFAALFAERWSCVVDNLLGDERHRIYSSQEIFELREQRRGFWEQGSV